MPEPQPVRNPLHRWRQKRRAASIARTPLFNAEWYWKQYPDVREASLEPALHYIVNGAAEGRWPHPLFDPDWYRHQLGHATPGRRTPLEHYLSLPVDKRPATHPLFDPDWYRSQNPEVAVSGIDPLEHFVVRGGREGRSPHPEFDAGWYLARYPRVREAGVNPLVHYLNSGHREGRNPRPGFSTEAYLDRYEDARDAGINPLVHYVRAGKREGRHPDPAAILLRNPPRPCAGLSAGSPDTDRSDLARRLRWRPQALVDAANRTVVSWSAKSACTHVLIWHLERVGLLDEAEAYSAWPHDFRTGVYYGTPAYRQGVEALLEDGPEGWTYVKVVRDPARRCISSYRHAIQHGYEDRLMSHYLNRDVDHRKGYSYADFLDYLERIDLAQCDVHHRYQSHPLDLVAFRKCCLIIIDEQDLATALHQIDIDQGVMPDPTRSNGISAIRRAARRHAPEVAVVDPDPEIWRKPLSCADAVSGWPKSELEACDAARKLARRVYAFDYSRFEQLRGRSRRPAFRRSEVAGA